LRHDKEREFVTLLAKYPGVTVDADSEENGTLILDSPKGKVFKANDGHCLVEPFTNISQSWKGDAYAELAARLAYGLADCDDADGEVCHPEEQ
jgi:hypothetical protein